MEGITVLLQDADFDAAVHAIDALPEGLDIKLCVKRKATVTDQPAVCITWSVKLPSGNLATCQAVTTWAALQAAVRTIAAGLERPA